jgi:purine-binding chemotaxis protein CheW
MSVLHVLFKVAGAEYALPAADVLHLESFISATKVPGAPAHVIGILQVRGRVVPVIDLRLRFGLPAQDTTAASRVVVVQAGARVIALLADSAREVAKIDPAEYRPAPEMMADEDGGQGFVRSVARASNRLVMLIDLPRVVGYEQQEKIDGQ